MSPLVSIHFIIEDRANPEFYSGLGRVARPKAIGLFPEGALKRGSANATFSLLSVAELRQELDFMELFCHFYPYAYLETLQQPNIRNIFLMKKLFSNFKSNQ